MTDTIVVILVALCSLLLNIPLGDWRRGHKRFSVQWFLFVHASVPVIIALRLLLHIHNAFIPLFIALAVLGQYIGGKNYRLLQKKSKKILEVE